MYGPAGPDLFLSQFDPDPTALKTLDTNGQRSVFSLGVSQHMHKKKCENLSSIGRRSCEIIIIEETPLSHEVVCVQMLDFENSNSKSEVSKSNWWKITSFLKTTPLQKEPFLTMFYTTNLSPLLVPLNLYANNYFE